MIDDITTLTPQRHEGPRTQPLATLPETPVGQSAVQNAAGVWAQGWLAEYAQEPPKGTVIAAGPIDRIVSDWLLFHHALVATIEVRHVPITLIALPEAAIVAKDGREWRYCVSFYGPDGNEEEMYLEVITDGINAAATTLTLRSRIYGDIKEEEENDGQIL